MSEAWGALAAVASALLVVAGPAKVRRPWTTAVALHVTPAVVRAGAAVETALGVWALAWSGPVAHLAVATSYLGFAAFVGAALARGTPVASCGCFGEPDVPPTVAHVVLDLGMATAALGAAATGAPRLVALVGEQPLGGVPLLGLVALGTAATALAMTWLPRLGLLRVPAR